MKLNHLLTDLRGAAQLACDATIGVTGVVEQVHGTILQFPLPLGRMRRQPDAGLAKVVYDSIRGTTRGVDWVIGSALKPFVADGPEGQEADPRSHERNSAVAALNGILGDHLEASGNPLAQSMALRLAQDESPSVSTPRRWLLLIHGMCMHDRQWTREGHDHGKAIAAELGLTPVYLQYNTGLSVAENGRRLSLQLEEFVAAQMGTDDELSVLAYSLGGLVTRSAIATADIEDHGWIERLERVVFLGTPHAGAPLAKGSYGIDRALGFSPYSAAFSRLTQSRSAGLRDLRLGLGRSLHNMPKRVRIYSVAGLAAADPGGDLEADVVEEAHGLASQFLGDGLVSVSSALALPVHLESDADSKGFDHQISSDEHHWIARGVTHVELLSDRGVCRQLVRFLT